MPEIDIFGNKAIILLSGSIVLLIALLLSIKHARKLYWNTSKLSKRKRERQKSERPRIVWIIAGTAMCAMSFLLALTIHLIVGTGFALVSMLALVIFTLPTGRQGNKVSSNEAGWYTDYGSSNSVGDCSDGAGDSGDC